MRLYKNILLTIDCSPVDDVIINHIIQLAKIHNSQVHLLHVIHSHTLDQNKYLREEANKYIEKYKKDFDEEKIKTKIIIRSGEPEKEIIEEIEAGNYDLIAMATHGHKYFLDILYGSVSDTLKHKINTPILLIKGN